MVAIGGRFQLNTINWQFGFAYPVQQFGSAYPVQHSTLFLDTIQEHF